MFRNVRPARGEQETVKKKEAYCSLHQAPVVQKVDNVIHWINHYPVDSVVCFVNTDPLDSDLSSG